MTADPAEEREPLPGPDQPVRCQPTTETAPLGRATERKPWEGIVFYSYWAFQKSVIICTISCTPFPSASSKLKKRALYHDSQPPNSKDEYDENQPRTAENPLILLITRDAEDFF